MKKQITDKDRAKFIKNLNKNRKEMTKLIKPRICYTKDYDIFSICWGNKDIESTIETNLLGLGDCRFDITKNGVIVGIEIEDFSRVLEKFNCDKHDKPKNM